MSVALRYGGIALVLAIGLLSAQEPAAPEIVFELVAEGVRHPTAIADPADGSGRLFFASQFGQILIHDGESLLPEPFLDVGEALECCGETGLLDLEFHPNFATNGRFYVSYTSNAGPNGVSTISSFQVSDAPNRADPDSETVLLSFEQPTNTHNAGQIEFGPDGMLYASFGDGGLPFYEEGVFVSRELDSLLGKIIRVDVDGGEPYAIPPDNPFAGVPEARGEIWLKGLRNPWRFSFDRETDDLFIGDVGATTVEEIDFFPAGGRPGADFGWPFFEASHCTLVGPDCDSTGIQAPILEFARDPDQCRSITGGFRYRGREMPQLRGRYIFADWCTGELWAATETTSGWQAGPAQQAGHAISTFGEDERGELYAGSFSANAVYRLRTAWPRPELSAVAPTRIAAGGQSFRLTLVGAGFVPGTIAYWDGEPLHTRLIDDSRLQVTIEAERIAEPGPRLVEVRNPEPNPGPSAVLEVTVEDFGGASPAMSMGGIVGAARLQAAPLAPGQAFSIFGTDLAAFTEQAIVTPLPTSLGGVSVRIGEEAAPLLFASSTQINAVAPWGLPPDEEIDVYVERGPLRSAAQTVPTSLVRPGVFTLDQSGAGQGAVLIAGLGILAASAGTAPGARPVRRGEAVEVYATGLGPVLPSIADGMPPGSRLSVAVETPVAAVGRAPAQVLFAGLAPGFVGLYQVNVLVPDDAPTGDAVPLTLASRGAFSNPVTLAVE